MVVDTSPQCAILSTVTQTISGRFFILNAGVYQQNMLGLKRPVLVDNRPVVCVTASAASTGRFAFRGEYHTMKKCEWCGGGNAVKTKKHADGKKYTLCWNCRASRSKEYEKLRSVAYAKKKSIIRGRGRKCEQCGKETGDLDLHHAKRLIDGGTNDNSNLVLVCKSCHRQIHAKG